MSVAVQSIAASPRNELVRWFRKFFAFYRVYFGDALVYRANAVIWLLTDTFPAVIMPLLWLASYNGRSTIHGFTPSQMVVYYMVILFLSCTVESHIMWDMYTYVRDGLMTVFLARPYSLMGQMFACNGSWRLMRTLIFVPLFCIVLAMFHHWVHWDPSLYNFGWQFWLAMVLGHLVSYFLTYAMGLLTLYFIEVGSIYNFYYLPLVLFNGQIAPIAFFPPFIAKIAYVLPFAWTLSFPAQVFIRQVQGQAVINGYLMQVLWIVVGYLLATVLYRQGIKRFTAFGI